MNNYNFNVPLALSLTNPELYPEETQEEIKMCEELKMLPQSVFEKKAYQYFNNLYDKTKGEYWSDEKIEYDLQVNKEVNDYLKREDVGFTEVMDFAFNRMLHYLAGNPAKSKYSSKKYDLCGTVGNSRPDQCGCFCTSIFYVAKEKLHQKYGIPSSGEYSKDLGYGHKATRSIGIGVSGTAYEFNNAKKKGWFFVTNFTVGVSKTDKGFHDELEDIVPLIKKDFETYKKTSKYLNTPLEDLIDEIRNNNQRNTFY